MYVFVYDMQKHMRVCMYHVNHDILCNASGTERTTRLFCGQGRVKRGHKGVSLRAATSEGWVLETYGRKSSQSALEARVGTSELHMYSSYTYLMQSVLTLNNASSLSSGQHL